jgi:hypothetical protein
MNDNGVGNAVLLDGEERRERQKVMGFVGIQTGFGSSGRRRSLRKTWMPSDRQGLQRYRVIPFLSLLIAIVWILIGFCL